MTNLILINNEDKISGPHKVVNGHNDNSHEGHHYTKMIDKLSLNNFKTEIDVLNAAQSKIFRDIDMANITAASGDR